MNKLLFAIAIVGCLALCPAVAVSAPNDLQQGVVRVKLQPELATRMAKKPAAQRIAKKGQTIRLGEEAIDESIQKIKGYSIKKVFPCSPEREAEHKKYGLDLWYEISFDESINPLEARKLLRETPGIEKANARKPLQLFENDGRFVRVDAPASRAASSMPFNDPRLPAQWHYHNDGSINGGVAGADINLFKAWQIETGKKHVVVAIIDGGVDVQHEDLAAHMWVNEAELNGKPGVDDDGNGYIDDINGYNFCTGEGAVYPHDHGTHVAGTVGAINNNGIGVCGVAGGDGSKDSGVRLMSSQVFDSRVGVHDGDFAAAIVYAADMGATIAQCSWGWSDDGYYEEDVLDAIRYFTKTARSNNMIGGLCIFAAGNDGATGEFYPQCMDEVIAVGAMNFDYTLSSYTNSGKWVDVIAPGGDLTFNTAEGVLSTVPDNGYGYKEGTSMATPHVSGIAALILSKYGSNTLINETVRQQIITSVNDIYAHNPNVEQIHGNGFIDAFKALQWGDGTPPAAVSDLEVVASQDNVTLTWTIPQSSDNQVNSHIIYYSESPIDASQLDKCKSIVVDTKFFSSGDKFSYEIGGLSPLTTYYFAVKAVNRWSNASELSAVASATTNAGPKMTVSRTAMTIRTNDGSTWTNSSFDITNTGEGFLKWKPYFRTFSSSISPYSTNRGLQTQHYNGHLALVPYSSKAVEVVEDIEAFSQDDYPREFSGCQRLYAFIGDTDFSKTNSMAQLFTVDPEEYPDGFNLTHLYMMGTYGLSPKIEIYRNTGTLASASLMESMQTPDGFSPYYGDIALNESLYFGPGESFYVVVHFQDYEIKNYPLGLGLSNGASSAKFAYISNNWGETWTLLSEALRDSEGYGAYADQATWAIYAISKYPDWSQVLTLDPSQGQVMGGEKQTVTLSHNGTKIPNGNYRARLRFDTNEAQASNRTINVNINVAGHKPSVDYSKVVQFGNLLVGQSKTVKIKVTNTGYGAFAGGETSAGIYSDKIASTSEHFAGPEYLVNGIPARSTVEIELTYTPKVAGSHNGQIILTDKNGTQLKINVQGAATDPAKLVADPAEIEVGDLDADGTEKEVSFVIRNEGNYPLQYVMPKFTDETYDEVMTGDTHRFGYIWTSNLYGSTQVEYPGAPKLVGATDVTSQLSDYTYFTSPIDIGFQFPFYGKTYDKIYISSLGILTFAPYLEGSIYSPVYETNTAYLMDLGVISAYGFECQMAPNTHIEYARQDGKFVVNFSNVLVPVYDNDYMYGSYHISLSPNGDIEICFDDYTAAETFQEGANIWVGIVDPAMEDPLTVTSSAHVTDAIYYGDTSEQNNRWRHIGTGTAFRILAPKPNMIRSIAPAAAMIAPNEQIEVKATVGAIDEMYAGETNTLLVVQSNDLVNPTTLVNFKANVVGDLKPLFQLADESVEFGKVFRTANAQMAVGVLNRGRNTLVLQSASLKDGNMSHNLTAAIDIPAGQSKDIIVTMPTDTEGEISDVLTIVTSDGTKQVALHGEVIGVPDIAVGYESISKDIPYGESANIPLSITNTGNEALSYTISTGEHLSYTPVFQDGAEVKYTYVAAVDNPEAKREWYEIVSNGLGTQHNYTYFLKKDIVAVDLPFEFPYFGKKYSKMYIYDSGFVSFTERNDDGIWPDPPAEFPAGSTYSNVIAPYWGLHSMDVNTVAGIYHYVNDQEAVVSYIQYGNALNSGIDFQLILHKDGTFTFNYKADSPNAVLFAAFGLAGISDENFSGIKIPERYIDLGNSVNFYPVVEVAVEPGQTIDADIVLNADALAGAYKTAIEVATNIPTKPLVKIPVTMNVTGVAKAVWPDDIAVEHVAGYQDTNYADVLIGQYGAFWYSPIIVANEGAAAFTITGIDIDCPLYDGENQFSLYYYGTYADSWTGSQMTGWTTYNKQTITVGTAPVRFAVPVTQADYSYVAWQTPGVYDIKLTFHVAGIEGVTEKVVNVKYTVTQQPTIELLSDKIHVQNAADDQVSVESFTISNANGKHKLEYSIYVDATGKGEDEPEMMSRKISTMDVGKSEFFYDTPNDSLITYRRALYWPGLQNATTSYNFGAMDTYSTFKAATAYKGPKGGFNISHIYTAVLAAGLDNKDILVEIYNGNPQETDDVLGHGTYHLGNVGNVKQSSMIIIPLERPVFISEDQEFYVVISFPAGQPYPASLIMKEEGLISNRYMGWYEGYGWFDVASIYYDQYGSLGYVMSCLETREGDAWVKILDGETPVSSIDGEIAAGAAADIKVRLSAEDAPKDLGNKAMLVIHTNDPKRPVINFPVYLDKNGAPVITAPTATLLVNEGDTLKVKATVLDPEGEDMLVMINDNGQMSKITNIACADGEGLIAADGLSGKIAGANEAAQVEISIMPEFGSAGNYSITLGAIDSLAHESTATIKYMVSHVNQAPVAIEREALRVAVGGVSQPVRFADLFVDPDGDELTYEFEINNTNSVQPYLSDNSVIIEGKRFGNATITVTATDPYGASATNTFKVTCAFSGIDDIEADDANSPAYNIQGIQVDPSFRGVIIQDGQKYLRLQK